jgi:hypothetical protein
MVRATVARETTVPRLIRLKKLLPALRVGGGWIDVGTGGVYPIVSMENPNID